MFAISDWGDPKRRYSVDVPTVSNANLAQTYAQGRFNQSINLGGVNRKWSTSDMESFGSLYREQSSQRVEGLSSKVLSQNRTREFEENYDSIEAPHIHQDLENDDNSDQNFEADLKRSLERFIDADDV